MMTDQDLTNKVATITQEWLDGAIYAAEAIAAIAKVIAQHEIDVQMSKLK